ncbi:hypothetical protein BDN72DRAFT_863981 [Pluteus cervinus]|uniref:Uncharacterized protein n=1 Tax=Pluteus cervinus TaxID=181527 RepID=A0ACD3A7Z8_9AGAR|nr:hypothetical protein BDN72DRAFT_863981 [Pluteus cervinus]
MFEWVFNLAARFAAESMLDGAVGGFTRASRGCAGKERRWEIAAFNFKDASSRIPSYWLATTLPVPHSKRPSTPTKGRDVLKFCNHTLRHHNLVPAQQLIRANRDLNYPYSVPTGKLPKPLQRMCLGMGAPTLAKASECSGSPNGYNQQQVFKGGFRITIIDFMEVFEKGHTARCSHSEELKKMSQASLYVKTSSTNYTESHAISNPDSFNNHYSPSQIAIQTLWWSLAWLTLYLILFLYSSL